MIRYTKARRCNKCAYMYTLNSLYANKIKFYHNRHRLCVFRKYAKYRARTWLCGNATTAASRREVEAIPLPASCVFKQDFIFQYCLAIFFIRPENVINYSNSLILWGARKLQKNYNCGKFVECSKSCAGGRLY